MAAFHSTTMKLAHKKKRRTEFEEDDCSELTKSKRNRTQSRGNSDKERRSIAATSASRTKDGLLSDGESEDEDDTSCKCTRHCGGKTSKQPESSGTSGDDNKREHVKIFSPVTQDEWKKSITPKILEKRRYPEDYKKTIVIKGACPLSTDIVQGYHEDIPNDNAAEHQLNGTALGPKGVANENSVLEKIAKKTPFMQWTSKLLSLALNQKTSKPPEKSLQTLFLAVGIPPFVLVMYEPDSSGKEEESARNYSSEIARVLTRSLLNYCHCEFILLACALPRDTFSEDLLSKEVEERRMQTSKIYYRRQQLSRSQFLKLKEAVTIVSRVSPVSQHLSDTQSGSGSDKTSQTLVILDQAWYNLVLYFVKIMDESLSKTKEYSQCFNFTPDCSPNVILKAKAAAKEAGRRLCLKVQTTEDKDLQCLTVRVEKPLEQK